MSKTKRQLRAEIVERWNSILENPDLNPLSRIFICGFMDLLIDDEESGEVDAQLKRKIAELTAERDQLQKVVHIQAESFRKLEQGSMKKEVTKPMGRPKKPVIMDGEKRFDGLTDAAKWLIEHGRREGKVKSMAPNISTCCHGRAEMAYGHTWKFEEE